jgi:hypothetical protein
MLDIKAKKKKTRIFLFFWPPIGRYHKNLVIWKKKTFKYGEIGSFFHEKSLVEVQFIFFKSKFDETSLLKQKVDHNSLVESH